MSVLLNAYGVHDDVTGTLVLTVHDPGTQVAPGGVKFYVTDGTGLRSAAQDPDRIPSPGVYEKDVLLSVDNETLIEPEVTLSDGTKLTPGAESFPRTSGMAITLVEGDRTERGTSLEIRTGLTVQRTADSRRPFIGASKSLLASAGQASRGVSEGQERSGLGGVPGALVNTTPLVDGAGLQTLVDPVARRVTTALGNPEGEAIEGARTASRKAGRAAGQGTRGVGEGAERSGIGGAPGSVRVGSPLVDAAGLQELLSPATRRMGGSLLGPSGTTVGSIETGANTAAAGLNTNAADPASYGRVSRDVPRSYAIAEVPAIASDDGKLDPNQTMSGSSSYPLETGDPVYNLSARTLAYIADDETNDRRAARASEKAGGAAAATGLNTNAADPAGYGRVSLAVPLAQAAANIEAIDTGTGKLDDSKPMLNPEPGTGLPAYPLGNGDSITGLVDRTLAHIADDTAGGRCAATVDEKLGGQRAVTALDSRSRLTDQKRINVLMAANASSRQSVAAVVTSFWDSTLNGHKIEVAAHSVRYGFGTVSYDYGWGLGASDTTYWVCIDDPDYTGGSKPVVLVTDPLDLIVNGRYAVGKVLTGSDGSTTTSTGEGGGTSIKAL